MEEENKVESTQEQEKQGVDATEQLRERLMKFASGKLRLAKPIRARGEDIEELEYDFSRLTGMDYVKAMDLDPRSLMSGGPSARQSIGLFAAAASKCMREQLDERDVRERIGIEDAIKAVQLSTIFFNIASQAGDRRITNE